MRNGKCEQGGLPCAALTRPAGTYHRVQDPLRLTESSNFAVVPYLAEGGNTPVRVAILESNGVLSRVSAPGFPPFTSLNTDVYHITPAEFIQGLPDCDANAFPVRCPSGACATLLNTTESLVSSCTCHGGYETGWACTCHDVETFSCSCGSASPCACSDLIFAASLYAAIQAEATCDCYQNVLPPLDSHTPGVWVPGINGSAGHWSVPPVGNILEIVVPGCLLQYVPVQGDGLVMSTIQVRRPLPHIAQANA